MALAEDALAVMLWPKWLLPRQLGRNGFGRRCFGRHGFCRVDNGWAALAFALPRWLGRDSLAEMALAEVIDLGTLAW